MISRTDEELFPVIAGVTIRGEEYDKDRWPAWREWAADAAGTAGRPSRRLAVERLKLLGVITG